MAAFDHILVVDFGSQVTELIARRIRDFNVYNTIVPYYKLDTQSVYTETKGIILSGGHDNLSSRDNTPSALEDLLALKLPILGICYGMQFLCHVLGGTVSATKLKEFGKTSIFVLQESSLFTGVWQKDSTYEVFMSHGDSVTTLPPGFDVTASSETCSYAAVADESKSLYGVQFHPEMHHTKDGHHLLENFVKKICKAKAEWTSPRLRETTVTNLRDQVGNRKRVICALSGGIDSMVTAKLLHEAIGDRLICVYVDNGLMRLAETENITALFQEHFGIPLDVCREETRFLSVLEGVTDPEEKRRLIGRTFIEVFDERAKFHGNIDFLAQGTLYPDVIESGGGVGSSAVKIKSHHNVGGLPNKMKLALVEPLRELFKDEVRELGGALGLPQSFIGRHPFPGPGLAVRLPGEVTKEKCDLLREVDDIFLKFLREENLYDSIWQAFAVLLPVYAVGVMGDARTYGYSVVLRAVSSRDGMTAKSSELPVTKLHKVADMIVNRVAGVNRVLYDLSSKPPGTIEWE